MKILYPRSILEPILKHLRREEQTLMKRKQSIASEDPFADEGRLNDNASDDVEAAEQFDHARAEALGGEVENALNRVKRAITRIDEGSYGMCVKCGHMIDTERLTIDPTAELCIECARKQAAG